MTSTARPATAPHEHYWVDAAEDEQGWHCTICGVTEYPGGEFDPDDEVLLWGAGGPAKGFEFTHESGLRMRWTGTHWEESE